MGLHFYPVALWLPFGFSIEDSPCESKLQLQIGVGIELGAGKLQKRVRGHRQQHSFSLGLTCNMFEMRGSDKDICKVPSSYFGES